MILLALLASFMLPIAVYLLVLALVNHRPFPVVVPGSWDAIGLVFAASGFLLVGGPAILSELYYKRIIEGPGDENPVPFSVLVQKWWLVWVCYYLLISAGSVALIWLRQKKTIIYNVDVDQLENLLPPIMDGLGLRYVQQQGSWFFLPLETAPQGNNLAGPYLAEMQLDGFAPLCHVTLHWRHTTPEFKAGFEKALRKQLSSARTYDNPVGSWFLGMAGLIFGVILLLVFLIVLTLILTRRW